MSFDVIATVTASTKKPAVISGGKRGAMESYLTGIKITELTPVSPELRARLDLGTVYELKQCFVLGSPDIKDGHYLTVGGIDYPVRYVAEYPATTNTGDSRLHLIIEELRQ